MQQAYDFEDLFRRAWFNPAVRVEDIAAAMRVRRQAVRSRARTRGYPNRYEIKATVDNETFARMWSAGLKVEAMAKLCGYDNKRSVYVRRHRLGLPRRVRAPGTGCMGGFPSITVEEWREMEIGRLMAGSAKG